MQIVGNIRAKVGESPFWSRARQALIWCDLRGQAVHCLVPATNEQRSLSFDRPVAAALPTDGGGMAVLLADGLVVVDDQGVAGSLSRPGDFPPSHRFNDVTIDPAGRLIAGTMIERGFDGGPTGRLYSFDGVVWRRLAEGFRTINGLAFGSSGDRLYLSDSHPDVSRVWTAKYDSQDGSMGPRAEYVRLDPAGGRPDGAAVDEAGTYWIAAIGGSRLVGFDPDGVIVGEVATPLSHPTKLAFGGADLRTAYVTSLRPPGAADTSPYDGSLMAGAMPVAGVAIPPLRLP